MSVTREELEFVIKAKNEANAAFQQLAATVNQLADGAKRVHDTPPIPEDLPSKVNAVKGAIAGLTAATATALASMKFFGHAVAGFADFEKQMYQVQGAANLTGEEFHKLQEDMEGLAGVLPVTTQELANIAETGADLGIQGRENIVKFTEAMAMMGVTSGVSGSQAAQSIAQLINVTGETADKAALIASVATRLGDETKATVSGLLQAGQFIAQATAQYGVAATEALAFGAAMAESGVNVQRGGMAISMVFSKVGTAVSEGGADLRYFAKVAGESAEEFKKQFEENASGAITKLLEGMSKLDNASKANVFKELGLGAAVANRTIGPLLNNIQNLAKAQELANDEAGKGTSLTGEYAEQMEAYANKVTVMRGNLSLLIDSFGKGLVPVLAHVVDGLTAVLQAMRDIMDFIGPWGRGIVSWGVLLASTLLSVSLAFKGMRAAAVALGTTLTELLSIKVVAVLAPWAIAIAGLTAEVVLFIKALSDMKEYQGGWDAFLAGLCKVVMSIRDVFAALGDSIVAIFDHLWYTIKLGGGEAVAGLRSMAALSDPTAAVASYREAHKEEYAAATAAEGAASVSGFLTNLDARSHGSSQQVADYFASRKMAADNSAAAQFIGPQPSAEIAIANQRREFFASRNGEGAKTGSSDGVSLGGKSSDFQKWEQQERAKIALIGMRGEALVRAQAIAGLDETQLKNSAEVNTRVALAVEEHRKQIENLITTSDENIDISNQSYEAQKVYNLAMQAGVDPVRDLADMEKIRALALRQINDERAKMMRDNGIDAQYARDQVGLLGMSNKAHAEEVAVLSAKHAAQKNGQTLTDEQIQSVRELSDAQYNLDESSKAYQRIQGYVDTVGDSMAAMVKGVLRGTQSMDDAFKGLIDTLADVAIQAAIIDPFKSWMSNSFSLGNVASFLGMPFADGGIMTSDGPMQLRQYAGGGVASSPQLAMFGEGSTPEAYVPLPDGRSIPVTMTGGGGVSATSINVSVNIQGNASSEDASKIGKETGRALQAAMDEWARRNQRPGGTLWNMGAT